jgi:ABC-type multidrug transport system fused ATPase/permease subunit
MANMLQALGTVLGGFFIAFASGWLMTLVCLAGIPFMLLGGIAYVRALGMKTT